MTSLACIWQFDRHEVGSFRTSHVQSPAETGLTHPPRQPGCIETGSMPVGDRRLRYLLAEARCYWSSMPARPNSPAFRCCQRGGPLFVDQFDVVKAAAEEQRRRRRPATPWTMGAVASASGVRFSRVRKDRSSLQARAFGTAHAHSRRHHSHRVACAANVHPRRLLCHLGQPLNSTQVATAQGPVIAYVNGVRWSADPGEIRLEAHDLVQLDVGDETPPNPFRFPAGL